MFEVYRVSCIVYRDGANKSQDGRILSDNMSFLSWGRTQKRWSALSAGVRCRHLQWREGMSHPWNVDFTGQRVPALHSGHSHTSCTVLCHPPPSHLSLAHQILPNSKLVPVNYYKLQGVTAPPCIHCQCTVRGWSFMWTIKFVLVNYGCAAGQTWIHRRIWSHL